MRLLPLPKDRRIFKRPLIALPCGCAFFCVAAPVLIAYHLVLMFFESDLFERIRAYVFAIEGFED